MNNECVKQNVQLIKIGCATTVGVKCMLE